MKQIQSKKKALLLSGIAVLLVGAGILACQRLFFTTAKAQVLTGSTSYGSFATTIQGTGITVPADSTTYTTASDTEILSVAVSAGDTVAVGDLLYVQDASEVDAAISAARDEIDSCSDTIADYQDQLTDVQGELAALTVTAPMGGHLAQVTLAVGDTVRSGDTLAVLSDESAMTLTQYFSYAYEGQITEGMSAVVSIPDLMQSVTARVTDIRKVERVTPQGTRCFAVTVTAENPGALTAGMAAGGYLVAGTATIYPAVEGALAAAGTKTILAEGSGTLTAVHAADYQKVAAGETLFVIDPSDYETRVKTLNTQIQRTQEKIATLTEQIADAEDTRANYEVRAQLAGKVIMVNVRVGDKPQKGRTAVMVYDLTTMSITAAVDELDIDYLTQGMAVQIVRSGAERDTEYTAVVTEVGLEATSSGGVATFPVTVTIDTQGTLSAGVNVSYTITAGDGGEGVLAPVAAVQSTDAGSCLFIKAETKPENAVELAEGVVPEGFWAVPVEVGVSSGRQVRILSGAQQEQEVFLGYQYAAPGGGDTTSEHQETETTSENAGGFPGGDGSERPSRPNGMGGGMGRQE